MSGSTAYPYDTIVYITDTIDGQAWQGSGVLIAPNEVLTAAHVVYSSTYGGATNVLVTPGYDAGSAPAGSATGTVLHYFAIQDPDETITNEQSQYDFAVIHLATPFTGLGTMGLDPNFSGGLANVSGYPASYGGRLDSGVESLTVDPGYTVLDGTSLGSGSSGGPVWVTGSQGDPEVAGLVSSEDADGGGYFAQLTPGIDAQIKAWLAADATASVAAPLTVADTTTGQALPAAAAQYGGPVSGLQNQYVDITADSLNVTTATPNWFINTGSGNDAINVSEGGGNNVLDGGIGSNFLTGGGGDDTFYLDDRNPAATAWSTVVNFHAGDGVTIWGVTPQDFTTTVLDNQGAAGFTGVTIVFNATGEPATAVTLAGYTSAALTNGILDVSYGRTTDTAGAPGAAYMHIQGG